MHKGSNGVSLREFNRESGMRVWRDEMRGEGGKKIMRRKLRRISTRNWKREIEKEK